MPALRLLNALGRRVSGVRRKLSAERLLGVNVKRKGMRDRSGEEGMEEENTKL